ncbi:hypothetical protein CRE_28466 [Caenorhabditis remanei]|uniref:Uncharacterized protein n=2 Tax=Caenorhabditis remanei TaxID=31234 RepID=E3LMK8_CAERE|nr:hypothetical protein CRE_28466 [Caenorhabditis remanei]
MTGHDEQEEGDVEEEVKLEIGEKNGRKTVNTFIGGTEIKRKMKLAVGLILDTTKKMNLSEDSCKESFKIIHRCSELLFVFEFS